MSYQNHLYYYMIHYPFNPSFIIDITPVWSQKQTAIASYGSQFTWNGEGPKTAISQPDFTRFIEARARFFGAMIGTEYGEAFFTEGPLGFAALPGPGPGRGTGGPLYNPFL